MEEGEKEQEDVESRIRQTFTDFDKDGNGFIDRSELDAALRSLGMKLSQREMEEIMDDIDSSKNGDISYQEFRAFMMKVLKTTEDQELGEIFALLDRDEDGWITPLEVRYALHCLGEDISDAEAEILVKAVVGEDGKIGKDDFIRYIQNK